MKRFEVKWDDFSGGYFVGNNDVKQPMNTWTGKDIGLTPDKGYLVPLAPGTAESYTISTWCPTLATTGKFVYGDGANMYYQDMFNGTYTSVAISGASAATGTNGVEFQSKVLWPATTAYVILFNLVTNAVTKAATPVRFYDLGVYKEWALGVGASSNRLYFSAPGDAATWDSNDYIDVGSSTSAIRALVVAHDVLYVGTETGWWAVSGVLGETTTQRFVASAIVASHAAAAGSTIIWAGVTDGSNGPINAGLRTLSGTLVRGSHFNAPKVIREIVNWGSSVAGVDYDGDLWLYDPTLTRAWTYRSGGAAGLTNISAGAIAGAGGSGDELAYYVSDGTTYEVALSPKNPKSTAGAQTVDLADYQHNKAFRVNEVIVELSLGTTSAAMTRSVGVSLKAPNSPIGFASDITAMTTHSTARQTYTLPRMASTAGERPIIQFNANLTGDTYSVQPSITLEGVMLRRVIMRCQEVD